MEFTVKVNGVEEKKGGARRNKTPAFKIVEAITTALKVCEIDEEPNYPNRKVQAKLNEALKLMANAVPHDPENDDE